MRTFSYGKSMSRLCRPVITLLALLFANCGTAAALTWDQFSRSVNKGFTERQPIDWNNIMGIVITLVIFVLLMWVFHLYNRWQEKYLKAFYLEFRRRMKARASTLPDGRKEKRQWFRMRTRSKLKWFVPPGNDDDQYHSNRMVNISGGGLSFTTAERLDVGTQITFLLDIGAGEDLPLNGRVVRLEPGDIGGDMRYFVAIQFNDIDKHNRQRLVNWIMQGQRDDIRRHNDREERH